MVSLIARIERALFGASAEERVDLLNKLVEQRVDQALSRAFSGLDADDDEQENASRQDEAPGKDGAA